jgi:hypothetical protein
VVQAAEHRLHPEVVARTGEKYREAYRRLVGADPEV